ncbi:MAG: hypothetical protein F2786_05375 [Actinobacteria bacterium]|uniref:Unannotated protein n=1 Tax=freshwater metagenome TaxID=449393 RepID=A0A6J7DY28_9ZZZZ|nr:hypothetical protein [Actinomycetota bacterium]
MSQKIIVVGSGNLTTEIYETSILLGFDILILDLLNNSPLTGVNTLNPLEITNELRKLPIIMGAVNYPENAKFSFLDLTRKNREKLYADIQNLGFKNWTSIIHPSAVVSASAKIGKNVFIGANSTVSTNCVISNNTRINRNVSIGHDVTVGTFCDISPGAVITGAAVLENSVFIGAGAVLINGLRVGEGASVAAGSVVTRSVDRCALVMGSPARTKNQLTRKIRKRIFPYASAILKALKLHTFFKRLTRRY